MKRGKLTVEQWTTLIEKFEASGITSIRTKGITRRIRATYSSKWPLHTPASDPLTVDQPPLSVTCQSSARPTSGIYYHLGQALVCCSTCPKKAVNAGSHRSEAICDQ
jgi:hypothetical protein